MNNIKEYTEKIFEEIKHIDERGNEYWEARELMPLLEYSILPESVSTSIADVADVSIALMLIGINSIIHIIISFFIISPR